MTDENGNTPTFRAEVGMTLVVDLGSYEQVGRLMDDIGISVRAHIHNAHMKARFDFTHFNTHPCKAALIRQIDPGQIPGEVYDYPVTGPDSF